MNNRQSYSHIPNASISNFETGLGLTRFSDAKIEFYGTMQIDQIASPPVYPLCTLFDTIIISVIVLSTPPTAATTINFVEYRATLSKQILR